MNDDKVLHEWTDNDGFHRKVIEHNGQKFASRTIDSNRSERSPLVDEIARLSAELEEAREAIRAVPRYGTVENFKRNFRDWTNSSAVRKALESK